MNRSDKLTILSRQEDVSGLYNKASLVVNLSNRHQFIETFGMTALEAMAAGLPVIVPTVGGIAEMVEDGVNGYKIDVQQLGEIKNQIEEVFGDRGLYRLLAENAYRYSQQFSEERTIAQIGQILYPFP